MRRIQNLPTILLEHLALIVRQTALWVVQNQARTQRCEGRVDVDGVGVAREIDRMDPVVGEVAAQPFDAFEVGCKPVLDDEVFAKAEHVGGVEKGFFLGGDEELFGGPLQALFDADFVAEVIGVIIRIRQARLRCGFVAEIRVFFPCLLYTSDAADD